MAEQLGLNPWLSIWFRPRKTIRAIVNHNPKFRYVPLAALYGFLVLMGGAQAGSLGVTTPLHYILLGALVLALPVGMLGIWFTSLLLTWTGKCFKAVASYPEVRAAVTWANALTLANLLIWFIYIALFREQTFVNQYIQTFVTVDGSSLVYGLMFFESVFTIWSIVALIKMIAEVQGFSAWISLLNIIIVGIVQILVYWAGIYLFWMGLEIFYGN